MNQLTSTDLDQLIDELDTVLYERRHATRDLPRRVLDQMKEKRAQLERQILSLLRPGTAATAVERRHHARVPCALEAIFRHGAHEQVTLAIADISVGGARVQSTHPVALGERVELSLRPQDQAGTIDLTGTVAWVSTSAFGVAFTQVTPATERALFRLVLRVARAQRDL